MCEEEEECLFVCFGSKGNWVGRYNTDTLIYLFLATATELVTPRKTFQMKERSTKCFIQNDGRVSQRSRQSIKTVIKGKMEAKKQPLGSRLSSVDSPAPTILLPRVQVPSITSTF